MIFMLMKLAIPTFAPFQCGGLNLPILRERERGGAISGEVAACAEVHELFQGFDLPTRIARS